MATRKNTRKAAPSKPATAGAPAGAELLDGELPGAVPYRHPDTGARLSRRDYVALMAKRRQDATAEAWEKHVDDAGRLVTES